MHRDRPDAIRIRCSIYSRVSLKVKGLRPRVKSDTLSQLAQRVGIEEFPQLGLAHQDDLKKLVSVVSRLERSRSCSSTSRPRFWASSMMRRTFLPCACCAMRYWFKVSMSGLMASAVCSIAELFVDRFQEPDGIEPGLNM